MKVKIPFLLIIALYCAAAAASAQSGRVQSAPADPLEKPNVQVTQDPAEIKKQDAVTYSESVPNTRRPFYPPNKNKSSKSAAKTDVKKSVQPAPKDTQGDGQEEAIKIETNLVTIPVAVTDRNGFYITDLRQADFRIFENGVEQEVAYFGASEKPFTVVLLIDVSNSTAYKIEEIQTAAASFVRQLKPEDRVVVIEFDTSVKVLTELTNDRDKIDKAIKRTGFGKGTSLYEAVAFSVHKLLDKVEGRKAIVLFTDGVDTTSEKASYEGTVRDAEECEAVVFPIYYDTFADGNFGRAVPGGSSDVEYSRGRAYLNALADVTGGKVVLPEATPKGLTAAFESIAEELRRQYSIGYYPTNGGEPGERRQIKVRVERPKLSVRARDSYIVGGF